VSSHPVAAHEVGEAYLDLHHQLHRICDQAMGAAGLTLARAKVLNRLDDMGPMNQATLAGLLGHAPRSVTETVDALERDGLVARTSDENDRRARIVALTDAGRDASEAARVVRAKVMDEIFGSLSATERASFAALLTRVRTQLSVGERQ